METNSGEVPSAAPRWRPLSPIERRIVGVLVEKAKTTPDQYPLSLNALTAGCNQKSARDPQMNLTPDQVEDALEKLRHAGAVAEVQSGGRVPRYRHFLKDWLGVEGDELAVIAELLLRGPQTLGELRGRAARMAKIDDLAALKPLIESLAARNLVLFLTPEGRGQVVTHNLYPPEELQRVRRQFAEGGARHAAAEPSFPRLVDAGAGAAAQTAAAGNAAADGPAADGHVAALRRELEQLKEEVARLRKDVEDLWQTLK